MLSLREHTDKYPTPKEAEIHTQELKIKMKHFEEAMRKIRPLSKQELDMYKNVARQLGKSDTM
jgi:transitional endoplasmic reticulum ATPase